MTKALILAAGRSIRFGGDKRQAQLPSGSTVLAATVERYLECFESVVVVLRPGEEPSSLLPHSISVRASFAHPPASELGLGDSIAAGVGACAGAESVCIALADMPWVRLETLERLRATWGAIENRRGAVLQPSRNNRPGHPVFFDRALFGDLQSLKGDKGAASVRAHALKRVLVETKDDGVFRDIDVRSDLEAGNSSDSSHIECKSARSSP